jgi:hypothetical protein
MRRRLAANFVLAATAFSAAPASEAAEPGGSEDRPNVILIYIDDMDYTEIGAYGGQVLTPHMDRLAEPVRPADRQLRLTQQLLSKLLHRSGRTDQHRQLAPPDPPAGGKDPCPRIS